MKKIYTNYWISNAQCFFTQVIAQETEAPEQ